MGPKVLAREVPLLAAQASRSLTLRHFAAFRTPRDITESVVKRLRIFFCYYPLALADLFWTELRWELFRTSLYFRDKNMYYDAMANTEEVSSANFYVSGALGRY
jgi:hypothetical protein